MNADQLKYLSHCLTEIMCPVQRSEKAIAIVDAFLEYKGIKPTEKIVSPTEKTVVEPEPELPVNNFLGFDTEVNTRLRNKCDAYKFDKKKIRWLTTKGVTEEEISTLEKTISKPSDKFKLNYLKEIRNVTEGWQSLKDIDNPTLCRTASKKNNILMTKLYRISQGISRLSGSNMVWLLDECSKEVDKLLTKMYSGVFPLPNFKTIFSKIDKEFHWNIYVRLLTAQTNEKQCKILPDYGINLSPNDILERMDILDLSDNLLSANQSTNIYQEFIDLAKM